jgi:uncharacterized protein (TIGR03086 family)
MELLDCYRRATEWAEGLVRGALGQLDNPTPCDEWDVRHLISHMIDSQRYFLASVRGEDAQLHLPMPPDLVGDDPVGAYDAAIADALREYAAPGGVDKAGFLLGPAFGDTLIHAWDLATATGQDQTMPEGLAQVAYDFNTANFEDEFRPGILGPKVPVAADASPQEKLLAFSGRTPA